MPPLLSDRVGVPPLVLTVTASLVASVRVTVLPASRSAVPGEAAIAVTAGGVVSICSTPAGLTTAPLRSAALPAGSVIVPPFRATALIARSAVSWPGRMKYWNDSVAVPEPDA